ncbi:N-acyl-phosphatidylethanolamine-hydrolyzing phospholipase D [Mycena floridula]|nr:N-acyl-phosphatidylethanolamine-hydrolyzing phospholipase D [Mycena floridula]
MATVSEIPAQLSRKNEAGRPSHWSNGSATSFRNPWPSFKAKTQVEALVAMSGAYKWPSAPKDAASQMGIRKPTWGAHAVDQTKIKSTWLGHACFLVEMPSSSPTERGARILFDPVFSHRCSPVQWMGPARFTPPPCQISDIPDMDAVVISHNHYDHLDTHTITQLSKRKSPPHFFAPLGNQAYFRSLGIPDSHIHILDWWEGRRVEIEQPSSKTTVDITCTPAQHFTGRGLTDRFKTLWASWTIEEVLEPDSDTRTARKVFFAGDTGYRSVQDGEDEEKVPFCPAFKEIGEKFGGFDLALIPIGAYLPRDFMSPVHCAPQDSVRVFKDIRAKRALGMHWGTWILTGEDVLEPPKRLAEECKKIGIEEGHFGVCGLGDTRLF